MRHMIWLLGALVLGGCSTRTAAGIPVPDRPDGGVVIIDDDGARSRDGEKVHGRAARVPPGHYPPPGECRVWYPGRPPGHQPPPARCDSIVGRVPLGAFLLYNDTARDTEYDWGRQASRRPGSVPDVVLRIMNGLARS